MDIQTLISQLRQYNGYIEQAVQSLELAIQVDGTRRRGRPRKLHVGAGQPKPVPVSGTQPAKPKTTTNPQKG